MLTDANPCIQASLIFTVALLPETKFVRSESPSGSSAPSINQGSLDGGAAEKGAGTAAASEEVEDPSAAAAVTAAPSTPSPPSYPALHLGRPSRVQFSLVPRPRFVSPTHGWRAVAHDVVSPLQILATFPIVTWASFSMGFAANCLLALNLTQAQVFGPPPYLFDPAQIGFVNFAFAGGAVVGLVSAGPVSDWVSMRATRRNGGVREAEMRLPALVPYLAVCLVGMTVSSTDGPVAS